LGNIYSAGYVTPAVTKENPYSSHTLFLSVPFSVYKT